MTLEKQEVIDRIEVLPETGHIQVRKVTRILEDGEILSFSYHRHTISPGADTSKEDALVQKIVAITSK